MKTLNTVRAEKVEIPYYLRDNFYLKFDVYDQDNVAVDLSGKSLVFSIRETENGTAIATATTADSEITISTSTVTISKDFSSTLTEKVYYADLDNATDNYTIIDGALIASYKGR